MKRFILFLGATLISISSFVSTSFASTTSISLTSAMPDEEKSFVNITGSISGTVEEQQLTYLITEVENNSYNENDIYYINQSIYSNADGTFSFKLGVKGNLEAEKAYIVKIGGTNISEPVSIIVGTNNTGEIKFIIGDANGDGIINADDASIVLQYVLDPTKIPEKTSALKDFKERISVTGKEKVTAEDVACILKKALDSTFVFPVEKAN